MARPELRSTKAKARLAPVILPSPELRLAVLDPPTEPYVIAFNQANQFETYREYNNDSSSDREITFEEAISLYKEVIRLKPDFVSSYFNLSIAYYRTGQLPAAVVAIRSALGISNLDPDLHYANGVYSAAQGFVYDAKEAFQLAISINNKHAISLLSLGEVEIALGNVRDALSAYSAAFQRALDIRNLALVQTIHYRMTELCDLYIPFYEEGFMDYETDDGLASFIMKLGYKSIDQAKAVLRRDSPLRRRRNAGTSALPPTEEIKPKPSTLSQQEVVVARKRLRLAGLELTLQQRLNDIALPAEGLQNKEQYDAANQLQGTFQELKKLQISLGMSVMEKPSVVREAQRLAKDFIRKHPQTPSDAMRPNTRSRKKALSSEP